jgi:hypothetical protein
MKINPKTNWFDKQRFKTQLTLVFVVGILLLASLTSVVVSKISSGIIEDHQVLQGMQVTESLARQLKWRYSIRALKALRILARARLTSQG